jgi:hypothetical protein
MAETIGCPECTRKLLVPDELVGSEVKCPTCGATFTADVSAPPPPPLPLRVVEEEPAPRQAEESRPRPGERRRPRWDDEDRDDDYRPRRRFRRDWEPHRGALVLILGILGLAACALFSPVAWIMGSQDLAAMRAGRMDPEGEGLTRAGQVCGIIGSAILALFLVCGLFSFLASLADHGKF